MMCKPDHKFFRYRAERILSMSNIDPDLVDRIQINCGGEVRWGSVVLKDGTKIEVS